ncbi:alpha/beta hydrolase [Alisedimentitalea sp. MJ-SS2]|uniref:alpha/beta hydrolase n=1 Tax=Aliisedimentitalea sp. MJ-SS2 TaxID=3049795 RepID=UPI00290FD86A|nr:alpha/beta hydrolase [Alisedimentitalea sp. MJ-SS2]MDU8928813.1 alpha/beta hydrolase [Alisedimentitalea sp. MJ-SS2]
MTRPNRPSRRARVLNVALRLFEKRRIARTEHPEELRRGFERSAALFFHGPRKVQYESVTLGDLTCLKVIPPQSASIRVILYFHGGGYVMGSPRTHRAMVARLCQLVGARAILPDYRKAPEHPYPAAPEDALEAYMLLLDQGVSPGQIVLGGDSAGGGLALGLLGQICHRGLPQPAGCFAFSPLTDMSFSGDSFRENAEADVMLPAHQAKLMEEMYLVDHDPRDPRASPLYGNFTGACPVWLCVGTTEILLDDTRRMAVHLRAQGVEVTEVVAHDLPHVWPIFQRLMPEANATLKQVGCWISSRFSSSGGN